MPIPCGHCIHHSGCYLCELARRDLRYRAVLEGLPVEKPRIPKGKPQKPD